MNFPYPKFTIKDGFEILIIAFTIYQILILIRGTRAIQILQGFGVLFLSVGICNILGMRTLFWILNSVVVMIVVAIPIVFQPELRRALVQIGKGGILSLLSSNEEELSSIVDEIVDSCFHMSRKKVGAIIVIERDIGLEEFMETGTQLHADITSRLIQTIFFHNSPLHDGAVIIKENKIHSAGCYLPLTESTDISKDLGTRHRAAIGITEHTDCVSIVVSEETGNVSLCYNGHLEYDVNMESLVHYLREFCNPKKKVENTFFTFPINIRNLKFESGRLGEFTSTIKTKAFRIRTKDKDTEEEEVRMEKTEIIEPLPNFYDTQDEASETQEIQEIIEFVNENVETFSEPVEIYNNQEEFSNDLDKKEIIEPITEDLEGFSEPLGLYNTKILPKEEFLGPLIEKIEIIEKPEEVDKMNSSEDSKIDDEDDSIDSSKYLEDDRMANMQI